ncbi:MAG: AP2 domain-containing protein [Thermodesulfobacteriota bacterium]|nr:AP2 domain-containing protein [Thermodesulfobacteriota bacterium]
MKKYPVPDFKKSDKYEGVFYDNERPGQKRWVARANMSCARYCYIGNYETEREAAEAYNDYISKYKLDATINDLKNQK